MNKMSRQNWFQLSGDNKKNIFGEISIKTGLPPAAIEKDWWVVSTLEMVYKMEIAPYTVFKGGTSLSKAWGLINRFSEDIDLALDRAFLGFTKTMTSSQVKKLREHSYKFISEKFCPDIQKVFNVAGFCDVTIQRAETTADDQDPLIIEVFYPSFTEASEYLKPRVLIEIGSRSLMEPFTAKSFCSLVAEHFNGMPFADGNITIPTVNPERTFLEKIFLLHEEFQKVDDKSRVARLSRHLYDIEKMMDTDYEKKALGDKLLYDCIVEHRRTITPIRGIDYRNHIPSKIKFIPPEKFLKEWEKDYKQMQESMIYKESLPFNKLLERLTLLNERINQITFPE